jgi:hypothetical protein
VSTQVLISKAVNPENCMLFRSLARSLDAAVNCSQCCIDRLSQQTFTGQRLTHSHSMSKLSSGFALSHRRTDLSCIAQCKLRLMYLHHKSN